MPHEAIAISVQGAGGSCRYSAKADILGIPLHFIGQNYKLVSLDETTNVAEQRVAQGMRYMIIAQ